MVFPLDRRERQDDLDALRQGLSAQAFDEAWSKGQTFDVEQALAYAFGESLNSG